MPDERRARLRRELESFRSPYEDPVQRAGLIAGALPRFEATFDLLPPATGASRLLELGAEPFLASQCLDIVWPGTVTHANYYGTGERHGAQTLHEVGGDRTRTYAYDVFDLERDVFPYPDASFDVVLFAELLEHLAVNPVWALSEMHRVLAPGGHLVVTTPNALSAERLESLVTGRRPMVDRYYPLLGYGARHNREFAAWELALLLDETGFDVEVLRIRDVVPQTRAERVRRAALRALLRPFSRISRRSHIFVRARRRPLFRWRFPPALFGETRMYHLVRHPWVEMGVNDAIQCTEGWGAPVESIDGVPARRVRGRDAPLPGGSVSLRGIAGATRVTLALRAVGAAPPGGARVRLAASSAAPAGEVIGFADGVAVPARWTEVAVALSRPVRADEHLTVNVAPAVDHEVAVGRIALLPAAAGADRPA